MHLVFYIFVVLGILFYIYLIPANIINKKRDRMIEDMEKAYTRQKFKKCPHCSVLNPLDARVCEFCNKELPAPPQPRSPAPVAEQVPEGKPAVAATREKTVSHGHPAEKSSQDQLESFLFRRIWPVPNTTALISMSAVYILVIFVYSFFMGIYTIGKQGVKQVEEASREAAKRQAERQASYAPPSAPSQPQSGQPLQVGAHKTPKPVPTPTPLSVSGTQEEQITQLMLYLESSDWNAANQAKKLLIEKGEKAVPALVEEINHPETMVRTHVITALGEIASAESIPALVTALSQDDPVTVIQAATVLGRIPGDGVIDALSKALKHPDWRVRQAAVLSLEKLGDPEALPALLSLQGEDPNETVNEAVKKAVIALQQSLKKE